MSNDYFNKKKNTLIPLSHKSVHLGSGSVVRLPFTQTLEFTNTSPKEEALIYVSHSDCF